MQVCVCAYGGGSVCERELFSIYTNICKCVCVYIAQEYLCMNNSMYIYTGSEQTTCVNRSFPPPYTDMCVRIAKELCEQLCI